jgi:hypothetical protein
MKKKLLIGAVLPLFLVAAACSSEKEDNKTLRYDILDSTHRDMYGLINGSSESKKSIYDLNEDAKALEDPTYEKKERSGKYYDIYLASDVEGSLFTYQINFGEIFDKNKDYYKDGKFKHAYAETIQFSDIIRSNERSGIMSELYNKNYGIKTILDEDIINVGNTWNEEFKAEYVYDYYKAAEENEAYFEIIYLPFYVERTYDDQVILEAYGLHPIYAAFVNQDGYEILGKKTISENKSITRNYTMKDIIFLEDSNYAEGSTETEEE